MSDDPNPSSEPSRNPRGQVSEKLGEPRPLLPPPVREPAPTGNSRKRFTLVMWSLLTCGLLVVWQFFTPNSTTLPPDEPMLPNSDSGYRIAFWVLVVGVLLLFRFLLRRFADPGDFNLAHEPVTLAIAAREFNQALSLLDQITPRYRKKPLLHGLSLLYRAHAELWSGRLDEGISSALEADRRSGSLASNDLRTMAAADLAVLYTLVGDLAEARRWVEEGRARLARNRGNRLVYAVRLWVAECLMAARRGLVSECSYLLEQNRAQLMHLLNANTMRLVEVVGAFAANDPTCLLRASPTTPAEFAFLGSRWPEMRGFLMAHLPYDPSE